ncbi:MAG TPA: hypothetical protein VEY51_09130 [Chondromyces sp.]|nr:hypothetical protein [Chondromyces sp.]
MKKILFVLAVIVLACVFFANLVPLVGLVISGGIVHFAAKQFLQSETTFKKVIWGSVGIVALVVSVSNLPAIIGALALGVLYYMYKSSKEEEVTFTHFEHHWKELKNKFV